MVTALRVSEVGKSYAGVPALDGLDLTVEAGGIHGLLGPNGAGKTTLLRICLGLIRPDRGQVEVFGEPVRQGADGVAGFVESPAFWPYLTARRTLELLASLEDRAADIADLLDRVGLGGRAGQRVGGFSVGMRQRLGIAAALLRETRLLLLDEPASGLDVAGARDLRAILRELAADGAAIVLSSHVMTEVDALCTDASVLVAGRLVASGSIEELRARAPDPLMRLRTSDDERAVRLTPVTRVHGALTFRGTTPAVDALVLSLAAAGIAVRELTAIGSPLEDLFLELSGVSATVGPA